MKVKKEAMKIYQKIYQVSYEYNVTFAQLNYLYITNSFYIFLVLFKFYEGKPYSCKDVITAWLEILLSTPFSCFNIFMFLM